MTLPEARKILGLGPDDDPRPFLAEFQGARERIAEMVRTAPNETLAVRYQQGLTDFDRALAAIREHLGTETSAIPPAPPQADAVVVEPDPPVEIPETVAAPPPSPVTETAPAPVAREIPPPKAETVAKTQPLEPSPPEAKTEMLPPAPTQELATAGGRSSTKVVWLLTVILLAIAGGLFYLKTEEDRRIEKQIRVAGLERQGAAFVDNRRWPEATRIFNEIESLSPKSEIVEKGRRDIDAGMLEEQNQFVGYWTGQARASFEASRWDEAEAAAKQVLEKFPAEKEPAELLGQIARARAAESDRVTLASGREQLQQRNWEAAIGTANKVLTRRPDDEDAKALLVDATVAKEKAAADLMKAKALLEQARNRDQGQFDQQVVDWLREASALAPDDAEIKAHLEKIAAYARTVRVPGDFATPAEALAQARDRDRIILGPGTWEGPLLVNASVDLQGAGPETTLIQCPATKGNAITLGPNAKGTRITGISFRHESFDPGEQRYSAALIRGVTVDFVDCRFFEASGHGLAVIEGGHAIVSRCRFSDNGWDGIAASGPGSLLEIRDSDSLRNFGHGIESWDGAAVILTGNRCEENSRNGIHADNGGGSVTLEKNQLIGNREFGLVLGSAGSGKITGNIARGNLLGGFVIRSTAAAVSFSKNEATKNDGPGLVLDIGLLGSTYADNTSTGNALEQVLINANLTVPDPLPLPEPEDPTVPPRARPVLEGP